MQYAFGGDRITFLKPQLCDAHRFLQQMIESEVTFTAKIDKHFKDSVGCLVTKADKNPVHYVATYVV